MEKPTDITVNLPTEYLNTLSEVIRTGLLRAKLTAKEKEDLTDWWDAEQEFIRNKLGE